MSSPREFWACPQLMSRDAGFSERFRFRRAIDAVADLFGLEIDCARGRESSPARAVGAGPEFFHARLLELAAEAILRHDMAVPFWIVGTTGNEHARQRSWEGLGLDVFELEVDGMPLFQYVPLRQVVAEALYASVRNDRTARDAVLGALGRAQEIARAYQCLMVIQHAFGHGQRDRSQSYTIQEARAEVAKLRAAIERSGGGLASDLLRDVDPDRVRARARARHVRHIANADSQVIRLAPLGLTGGKDGLAVRYERVVIVEDDPVIRKMLSGWVRKILPKSTILLADIETSLDALSLRNEQDEDLIRDDQDDALTLFCFDLEIGHCEKTGGLPGGLWFLYHTSITYPSASRVVLTGHRSLDQSAMSSGAASVALKPLTRDEFERTINSAKPFFALWLVRGPVKDEWGRCAATADLDGGFDGIAARLRARLGRRGIELGVADATTVSTSTLARADVLILDWWMSRRPELDDLGEIDKEFDDLLAIVNRIRGLRSVAQVVALVPNDDRCAGPDGILQRFGQVLRDGDLVAHKPLWICGEHETTLERRVRDAIRSRPTFDVKYRVFTPLLGLIRPIAERASQDGPAYWAPLAVLLGGRQGFGVSLEALVSSEGQTRGWSKELCEDVRRHMNSGSLEAEWWKQQYKIADKESGIVDMVCRLVDVLRDADGPLNRFLTVERWLRYVLDSGQPRTDHDADQAELDQSLTAPLRKLFGGETRYEFGVRGGWYDPKGRYIPDVPLVFEFCAKRGIVARKAIREVIVRYLREKGGEQVVLVEETPISGYLQC